MTYKNPIDPSTWPGEGFVSGFVARFAIGIVLVFGVIAAWVMVQEPARRDAIIAAWTSFRVSSVHFKPEILLSRPLSVQLHVAGVFVAFFVGLIILLLPKGTGFHRMLGWTWVIAMIVVAATSIMMIADFGGGVNPLHAFTAVTIFSLYFGLTGIWRGNVRQHAGNMTGLFLGGMIIAGAFAFLPGRTMWLMFFGG